MFAVFTFLVKFIINFGTIAFFFFVTKMTHYQIEIVLNLLYKLPYCTTCQSSFDK